MRAGRLAQAGPGRSTPRPLYYIKKRIITDNLFGVDIMDVSPDSLSVMELRSEEDIRIAEKMLTHPLIGDDAVSDGAWNFIASST